ncbi:MAG: HEPN domain-containing protein [Gaiellaceae bacterium]
MNARLERSRQELGAARVLEERGFALQAISRAYYAAFYAAQEALVSLGETRSKHSGVLSAFGRRVVREGGLAEQAGRLLRSLFERRNDADYGGVPASREVAEAAIDDAERFVEMVDGWLAR